MASFDIAIHGLGLVGQSLALHLAKARFKVALVPTDLVASKSYSSSEDVRAFALGHAAKAWLAPIGAWSEGLDTTSVTAMHITGDAGGALDFKTQAAQGSLNWIVEVPALAARLTQLVASEASIQQLMQPDVHATLHVVCDRRSDFWQTQLLLQTQLTTTPYGQHAIAARLKINTPHGQTARQWFNDKGEVLALLPTGGADGSTYALVWSLTSSRAQQLAKAEPFEFLKELNAAQTDATSAAPLALQLASERAMWPLNLSTVDVWSGSVPCKPSACWVLAGDAAHTVHPLAGQGLNLGFGDVALLAQKIIALRDTRGSTLPFTPTQAQLQRMLRSYVRERKAAAARIAGVTDGLQLLYARNSTVLQGLRNGGMNAVNNLTFIKQWLIQQAQS